MSVLVWGFGGTVIFSLLGERDRAREGGTEGERDREREGEKKIVFSSFAPERECGGREGGRGRGERNEVTQGEKESVGGKDGPGGETKTQREGGMKGERERERNFHGGRKLVFFFCPAREKGCQKGGQEGDRGRGTEGEGEI